MSKSKSFSFLFDFVFFQRIHGEPSGHIYNHIVRMGYMLGSSSAAQMHLGKELSLKHAATSWSQQLMLDLYILRIK
jgi:hypothetical protein